MARKIPIANPAQKGEHTWNIAIKMSEPKLENLKGFIGMMQSFVKQKTNGHFKTARTPRHVCDICEIVFDYARFTEDGMPKRKRCPQCVGKIKDGWMAITCLESAGKVLWVRPKPDKQEQHAHIMKDHIQIPFEDFKRLYDKTNPTPNQR